MPLLLSKEALARLFLSATNIFKLSFFFFFYILSVLASELSSSLFGYEQGFDDGEEEEPEEEVVGGYFSNLRTQHLVADIIDGGEGLVFLSESVPSDHGEGRGSSSDDYCEFEEPEESFQVDCLKEDEEEKEEAVKEEVVIVEDITSREDSYLDDDFEPEKVLYKQNYSSPNTVELSKKQDSSAANTKIFHGRQKKGRRETNHVKEERKLSTDDRFFIFKSPREETKKQLGSNNAMQEHQERHGGDNDDDDVGESHDNSCTVGSTSKSSSESRSSVTYRDSGTEDPLSSSSSRRSCPKWESHTVLQKYDEEMMFLDRTSAQKIHETDSLKSFQVQPRSISKRIVHQQSTTAAKSKKPSSSSDNIYHNIKPYHELESAYVAQVCLAWEALSWNYNSFRRKQALLRQHGRMSDPGCPAQVAQQFQQFQVLLQRYIENEPYEHGRRPEVYARMKRSVAPKLLLVPEYHDDEDEHKEQHVARVSSASFLAILEDSIRTFMNFLRADKESPCQALRRAFCRRWRRGSVDPAFVTVMNKTNKKKKVKLKNKQRSGNCMRKKKLTREEEMEILIGLIDLKVVSRVLSMWDPTLEQLRWCEEKMTKLTLSKQGRLHRDSCPLFFPTH